MCPGAGYPMIEVGRTARAVLPDRPDRTIFRSAFRRACPGARRHLAATPRPPRAPRSPALACTRLHSPALACTRLHSPALACTRIPRFPAVSIELSSVVPTTGGLGSVVNSAEARSTEIDGRERRADGHAVAGCKQLGAPRRQARRKPLRFFVGFIQELLSPSISGDFRGALWHHGTYSPNAH